MSKSTRRCASKPDKPRPDFPLFAHATKCWAKKIRGKMHYFGPWADPDIALAKYREQRDDLHAGRSPRVQSDGLTVRDLVNRFLTAKRNLLDFGEIMPRSFKDYYATCERVIGVFGKTRLVDDLAADDFERLRAELARRMGPGPLGNEIQCVRVLFKYGYDVGLIDRPVRDGLGFKKPSRKTPRVARRRGPRMFEATELRSMLDAATVPLLASAAPGRQLRPRQYRPGPDAAVGPGPRRRLGELCASQDRHRPALPALAADGADGRRGPGRAAGAAGPGRRGAGVPDAAGAAVGPRADDRGEGGRQGGGRRCALR